MEITGIGFSLRSSEKKDLLLKILPNLDYDLIMEGKQSLTKEQALYLYDVSSIISNLKQ